MRVLVQEIGESIELELLLARCIQLLVESVVVRREASRRQRVGFRSPHTLLELALAEDLQQSVEVDDVSREASRRQRLGFRSLHPLLALVLGEVVDELPLDLNNQQLHEQFQVETPAMVLQLSSAQW